MKKFRAWICVLMLIVSLTSCGKQQSQEELEAWEAKEIKELHSIAALTFYDPNGESFQLGDPFLSGRPIVLHCWATRFPESTASLKEFEKAYQEYGDEVVFLMVNAFNGTEDTMEDAVAYIEQKGYTVPVVYDRQEEMKSRNITNFPYTVYINGSLEVVHIRNTNLSAEEIGKLIEDIL